MNLRTESEYLIKESAAPAEQEIVIRLENVSVGYRAPRERIRSFKEYAIRLLKGEVKFQEFRALRDVSLEIRQGEVFGIVGHNGAGKSTMLKVVSRVIKPTLGRVWVKGRVAPLLELGAGFHPELSGRENVFLNGTLLGHSRSEMEALFDKIVDFAELWDFIDAPLRTYSTGMAVRLGFAVATAKRPDILLVDELLSVGDERFQEKCAVRMGEFRRSGTSIMLVTHDSALVQNICNRAIWLDHGEARVIGDPHEVVALYHEAYHRGEHTLADAASRKTERPSIGDGKGSSVNPIERPTESPIERVILEREWFYSFDLPSGNRTACYVSPEVRKFHTDRLTMMLSVLTPLFSQKWRQTACLDIGCNQGFFSVSLAQQGAGRVQGIDAREKNIADAELIREAFNLPNLKFTVADWLEINPNEWEKFDIVLMFSLLFWLENPIDALRKARALTRQVLLVETPVAPEISGQIDWGSYRAQKPVHGSFALLDQSMEKALPIGGLTDLSLCPGRETLIWLLNRVGFSRVEVVPPPADAYEQLASGKRVMIAAYV